MYVSRKRREDLVAWHTTKKLHNDKHNPVHYPVNNPVNNPVTVAARAAKSDEWMTQQSETGNMRTPEQVHSFDSVLYVNLLLLTAHLRDCASQFQHGACQRELIASVTDVRTKITTKFSDLHHSLHVFSVSSNNLAGEEYCFLSNRGASRQSPWR